MWQTLPCCERLCLRKSPVLAGCAKQIYKEGGISALFKGNFATMVKVAPQTAIQFAVSMPTC
jgi:hypothetical protein